MKKSRSESFRLTQEDCEMLAAMNQIHDQVADPEVWRLREKAVASCKNLVMTILNRFHRYSTMDEDAFYDAGIDALLDASVKYTNPAFSFSTFAYTIIERRMIDQKRKKRKKRKIVFSNIDFDFPQQKEAIDDSTRGRVWKSIQDAGLNQLEQEILMAFAYNGEGYVSIMANHVNPTTGKPYTRANAKNVLNRALKKCRKTLQVA